VRLGFNSCSRTMRVAGVAIVCEELTRVLGRPRNGLGNSCDLCLGRWRVGMELSARSVRVMKHRSNWRHPDVGAKGRGPSRRGVC